MSENLRVWSPALGDLKKMGPKSLLEVAIASRAESLIGSHKNEHIHASLPIERPGVVDAAADTMVDRMRNGKFVVATIGGRHEQDIPIGFAMSRQVPQTPWEAAFKWYLNRFGFNLKPDVELEALHLRPDYHENEYLITRLGLNAVGGYSEGQKLASYADDEDTFAVRALGLMSFDRHPSGRVFEDKKEAFFRPVVGEHVEPIQLRQYLKHPVGTEASH